MLGYHLFTVLFEGARDRRPRIAGLDEAPAIPLSDTALNSLIDTLEDDDDVQKVYHNIELNEEMLEQLTERTLSMGEVSAWHDGHRGLPR